MKKVFVNGYGSIGSRITAFLKDDPEISVIGIGKYSPDEKVHFAISKGLNVYAPKKNLMIYLCLSGFKTFYSLFPQETIYLKTSLYTLQNLQTKCQKPKKTSPKSPPNPPANHPKLQVC